MIRLGRLFARRALTASLFCVFCSSAGAAYGQEAQFLEQARSATVRYHDISVAVSDGYRRIGADFPSLGEHWVNLAVVAANELRAASPPILIYARDRKGDLMLAGVAYTRILGKNDSYPSEPADGRFWHEHNGSVAEASIPLAHQHAEHGDRTTRLAVLHAWLWLENPDGVWAADNWALPFHRLGKVVDSITPAAGRGVSLLTGGDAYYVNAFAEYGRLDEHDRRLVEQQVADAKKRINAELEARTHVSAPLGSVITDIWKEMCDRIDSGLSRQAAARVQPLLDSLR